MWHFSIQGLPAITITSNSRGLLPHVFTLIPLLTGQLFSVALSVPGILQPGPGSSPVHLLCAVRTFLPDFHRDDSLACSNNFKEADDKYTNYLACGSGSLHTSEK